MYLVPNSSKSSKKHLKKFLLLSAQDTAELYIECFGFARMLPLIVPLRATKGLHHSNTEWELFHFAMSSPPLKALFKFYAAHLFTKPTPRSPVLSTQCTLPKINCISAYTTLSQFWFEQMQLCMSG